MYLLMDVWGLITDHIFISIIVLLILSSLLGSYLIWLGIIFVVFCISMSIFLFVGNCMEKHNKKVYYQNLHKDMHDLSPSNALSMPINILSGDAMAIGGDDRDIHFMSVDTHHVITFPESKHGNKLGFYLLNVRFKPVYTQEFQHNVSLDNPYAYDGGGLYSGVDYGSTNNVEHPTDALLTFTPVNLSKTIDVEIYNVKQFDIREIEHYFLLGPVEQRKLGL